MNFTEFPKIARLSRECIVTEKLDGTNAQIHILSHAEVMSSDHYNDLPFPTAIVNDLMILPGSRNRYITPKDDNYGFAGWVARNAEALVKLGEGRHFGEWWGNGIQRKYGLKEKRFSLFNTIRWCANGTDPLEIGPGKFQEELPACCGLVPVLYKGEFDTRAVDFCLDRLVECGSAAAPGFLDPEGVVVFHTAAGSSFKKTIKNDASPKSLVA